MTDLEKKKLIVEFMGGILLTVTNTTDKQSGILVDYVHKENYPDNQRYHSLDHLPYDKSWDWLMLVVMKINEILKGYDSKVRDDWTEVFVSNVIYRNIETEFDCCVDFIVWYNENKVK